MIEPIWVLCEVVLMLHDQLLSQFGGSAGIRDEGLLDSALGEPHPLLLLRQERFLKATIHNGFKKALKRDERISIYFLI